MKEEQQCHSRNRRFWWHCSQAATASFINTSSSHQYHTDHTDHIFFSDYCTIVIEVLHSLIEASASYSLKRTIKYIYIINMKQLKKKKKSWHIWKKDRPGEKLTKAPYFYHKQNMYKMHYFSNLGSYSIAGGSTPVFPSFPKMCPILSAYFHCWLWQNAPYSIHPFLQKNIPS